MARFIVSLCTLLVFTTSPLQAQITLTGLVSDSITGEPLPGATVFIPDLKTGTSTAVDGTFRLTMMPEGKLLIQVSFVGYQAKTALLDLRFVRTWNVRLIEKAIESQEVVITGSGISTDNSRTSTTITAIRRTDLISAPATNLINAIAYVPGLSEITTGGEISKPVIRGLGFNHVVTLNEGVRQEGQQWGDEHGIEIDPFSVDRVEVLKGPSSLFYGSDAMGGVINVLEPIHAPLNSIRGEVVSQFTTGNLMSNSSVMAEGNHNGLIWRGRGSYKNAAPYRTPPEIVYNSGYNELDYGAMLGINRKWGYSHLHFSRYDARIGMVEGERDSATGQFLNYEGLIVTPQEARSRNPELPFQKVEHIKISSVSNLLLGEGQLKVNAGFQDNYRQEFEVTAGTPSLAMKLHTGTLDIRYTRILAHGFEMATGAGSMVQDNRNKGIEFLVPDYKLTDAGMFLYGKKSWTDWTLNAGVRLDMRFVDAMELVLDTAGQPASQGDTLFKPFSRRFAALSGSTGFTWKTGSVLNFKFNAGSGFRAPNIAELGSNGIHPGTERYEIGNNGLHPEHSFQIDGEISADWDFLEVTFNGFFNYIAQYIYQRNIDGEAVHIDGRDYPVYRYVQGNSVLKGFELEIDFHPVKQLHFNNSADFVMGTNVSTGIPLPWIPAFHTVHKLRWTFESSVHGRLTGSYVEIGGQFHARQDRIDTFETPTSGCFLADASVGTKLKVAKQQWTIFLSGSILTNQTYYNHLSRLKPYGVHEMGWSLTAGIVIPFGIWEKPD